MYVFPEAYVLVDCWEVLVLTTQLDIPIYYSPPTHGLSSLTLRIRFILYRP